jgi:hypothetical protein
MFFDPKPAANFVRAEGAKAVAKIRYAAYCCYENRDSIKRPPNQAFSPGPQNDVFLLHPRSTHLGGEAPEGELMPVHAHQHRMGATQQHIAYAPLYDLAGMCVHYWPACFL